jgi:hypothetical protein
LKDGEVSAVVGGNINPMVSFLILVDFFCWYFRKNVEFLEKNVEFLEKTLNFQKKR